MKRPPPRFVVAYAAAILVAFVASATIVAVGEQHVDAQIAANAQLQRAIDDAWTAAAGRAATMAEVERLRGELGQTLATGDATTRSAAFVRDAARIAALHRTHVAAIAPAARVLRPAVPSERSHGAGRKSCTRSRSRDATRTCWRRCAR